MKKTLRTLGIALALSIAILLVLISLQPSEYEVTRSAAIDGRPEVVFEQVNDFHKWPAWSPWANLDPQAQATFEGPGAGEGALFRWAGNDEVGEGNMTIVESVPSERIGIRLEFIKPFAGVCDTRFTFAPEGEQTHVTWTMKGENNFVGKAICLFINTDAMIGESFEQGLDNLNRAVQANREANTAPAADAAR